MNTVPTLRPASFDDIMAITQVIIDGWRSAYAGIIPADYLAAMTESDLAERWSAAVASGRVAVAAVAEGVVGTVYHILRDDDGPPGAEIRALYVLSGYRGCGIGRRLLVDAAHQLLTEGATSLSVYCARDNPYSRFYARLGGIVTEEKNDVIAGSTIPIITFFWNDLRLLVV